MFLQAFTYVLIKFLYTDAEGVYTQPKYNENHAQAMNMYAQLATIDPILK